MTLSEEQIIDLFNEACRETFNGLERFRYFARAIEAEVQKQDTALIRQLVEALECSGEPDDPGHRCSHCDEYVDRNSVLRKAARARLEGKP